MAVRVILAMAAAIAAAVVASAMAQVDAYDSSVPLLPTKYFQAHEAGDWPRAIEYGRAWAKALPNVPQAAYNVACAYAMNGDTIESLAWLEKAIDRGFSEAGHLMRDPDLESVRTHPLFAPVLEKARRREHVALAGARASVPEIWLPPDYDPEKPAPVIVALHGYGATTTNIIEAWKEAAASVGAILAAPRAVRATGPEGAGFAWGTLDETDLLVGRTLDLVGSKHKIDPEKIVLTGFSQGGFMALNVGMLRRETFCGVIPVASGYLKYYLVLPDAPGALTPRYYFMVGEQDRSWEATRLAATALRSAEVDVHVEVYPGLGHAFPPERTRELREALDHVLRPREE